MSDPILPGGEAGLRDALASELADVLLDGGAYSPKALADRLMRGPLASLQSDRARLQRELAAVDLAFEGLEETDRARRIGHWIGLAAEETTRANAAEAELASLRAKTDGGAGEMRERAAACAAQWRRPLPDGIALTPREIITARRTAAGIEAAIRSLPLDPSPQGEGGGE